MGTEELRTQLGVPEQLGAVQEATEETRRALAHPTLAEAREEIYTPCGD